MTNNAALPMLELSRRYSAATTEAGRLTLEAAKEKVRWMDGWMDGWMRTRVAGIPKGFQEFSLTLDGVRMNYVVGPDNGLPLPNGAAPEIHR